MRTSVGFSPVLAHAALAAALLTAGCAAPTEEALPPPIAALEPLAEEPAPPAPDPAPTSVAALGLRGASTPAPLGGASMAAAGQPAADVGFSPALAAAESRTSQPPKDEAQLFTLLATMEAASPQAAAEPIAAAPTSAEPAAEPLVEIAAAAEPVAPAAPAMDAPEAADPAPTEVVSEPEAVAAAPVQLAALIEPPAPTPAHGAVEQAIATDVAPVVEPAAAPVQSAAPRLEDFYSCDYGPAERRGGVKVMECR